MKTRTWMTAILGLLLVCLLALPCFSFAANGGSAGGPVSSDVRLVVNGTELHPDVAPYIHNDRTFVPFRAIGEAIGAEVSWDQPSEMATYVWRGMRVQVSLNSENAFVNGTWHTLDTKVEMKNDRTMVPVRFVAEQLGCTVGWDEATRTVRITSPSEASMCAKIQSVSVMKLADGVTVFVRADRAIENVKKTVFWKESEKTGEMVICIENVALSGDFGVSCTDNSFISAPTASVSEDHTVTLTLPLKRQMAGQVAFSTDEKTMTVTFREGFPEGAGTSASGVLSGAGPISGSAIPSGAASELPVLDWRAAGKLVYLDPGHGGRDPGSVGKLNKNSVYESTINLAVALRVRDLLKEAGARVEMTREDDSYLVLYNRPTAVNTAHADLCVSIHNNSNTVKSVKGTEIMWHNMASEASFGTLTSKDLATCILEETKTYLNLGGRGMVDNSNLALVNRCLMPSCIVECAYLSNAENLAYMVTDDFTEKAALAIARGIIRALNLSVSGQ